MAAAGGGGGGGGGGDLTLADIEEMMAHLQLEKTRLIAKQGAAALPVAQEAVAAAEEEGEAEEEEEEEEEEAAAAEEEEEAAAEEAAEAAAGVVVGARGARVSPGYSRFSPTTIYRITNGFASHYNDRRKELVFVSQHETQTAAFVEVRRLCGHEDELNMDERKKFHHTMYERYHKNENYITPFLTKGKFVEKKGKPKITPKPGVIMGQIVGGANPLLAPIATQFVVVIDDHDHNGAMVRFPWGLRGWVKPQ